MRLPPARLVALCGALHLVASGLFHAAAMMLALSFEREPSLLARAVIGVGVVLVLPLTDVFLPAFDAVLPAGAALVLAALANSALWGFLLALLVHALRPRRPAPAAPPQP